MGSTILKNTVHWDAPSIFADSMMESGTVVRKKVRAMVTLKLDTARGRISTHRLSRRPRIWVLTT